MDKVWLVTGSASGLGRNIAEAVLESGDRLVATARDPRRLDDLVNKFGERVRAVSLDVADESAAQAAVQVALDAFGRLDVVVNNAGFGDIAPFEQLCKTLFGPRPAAQGTNTPIPRTGGGGPLEAETSRPARSLGDPSLGLGHRAGSEHRRAYSERGSYG